MALKIKIKKCGMVRKIEGVKKSGFYGKVIANGKKSFEEILKASTTKSVTIRLSFLLLNALISMDGLIVRKICVRCTTSWRSTSSMSGSIFFTLKNKYQIK